MVELVPDLDGRGVQQWPSRAPPFLPGDESRTQLSERSFVIFNLDHGQSPKEQFNTVQALKELVTCHLQ